MYSAIEPVRLPSGARGVRSLMLAAHDPHERLLLGRLSDAIANDPRPLPEIILSFLGLTVHPKE